MYIKLCLRYGFKVNFDYSNATINDDVDLCSLCIYSGTDSCLGIRELRGMGMDKRICNNVKRILSEVFTPKERVVIDEENRFVWGYTSDNWRFLIIHGYGTKDKPFEVILPQRHGGTIVNQYTKEEDLYNYLSNELKKELVIGKL
jgi:hypothetical protein